jgi:hypothetical protein
MEYKNTKRLRLAKNGDTQAGTEGSVSRFQEGVVLRCSGRLLMVSQDPVTKDPQKK